MRILDIKIWDPSKFISGDSTPKIDMKYRFFLHAILKRSILIIYSGNQQRNQRHQMHKIVFLSLKEKSGKKLTCDINQWKCLTKSLKFFVSQSLSQMKLLENILFILLIAIPCTSKSNLNPLPCVYVIMTSSKLLRHFRGITMPL